YRRDYRSVEELENAVNEYITYWNQKRIKLSLGGLSPGACLGFCVNAFSQK
ncbi:hypothetical protein FCZ44_30400, partial [Escherichia coli]|nr:hypothetical protein [Escherichia coli]